MGSTNSYDEYGIPAASTNSGRFQYTGQIWIPEIGMYHYKARVYSPTLGRFLQTDPIGYADQYNLYAYVGIDPVNHTDPSGLYTCSSGKEKCGVIQGYVRGLRTAAQRAAATGSIIRPAYQAHVARVANFIGLPGRDNGVDINDANLDGLLLGATNMQNGRITISLDLDDIAAPNSGATGAGVIAHEGSHGLQRRERGAPQGTNLLREVYRREVQANGAEQAVNAMLGERSSLWRPGMPAAERRNSIDRAAHASCAAVRDYYPERVRGQRCR